MKIQSLDFSMALPPDWRYGPSNHTHHRDAWHLSQLLFRPAHARRRAGKLQLACKLRNRCFRGRWSTSNLTTPALEPRRVHGAVVEQPGFRMKAARPVFRARAKSAPVRSVNGIACG